MSDFSFSNIKIEDNELKEDIKDLIQCFICLENIEDPRKCPYKDCKKLVCNKCLIKNKNLIKCACGRISEITNWEKPQQLIEIIKNISKVNEDNIKLNKLKDMESCPIHPDDFIKHYCIDCKKELCSSCFINDKSHINHNIICITEYKTINETIYSINIKLEDLKRKQIKFKEGLKYYSILFDEIKKDFINNINKNIKEIQSTIENIDNIKKELLKNIEYKYKLKQTEININTFINNIKNNELDYKTKPLNFNKTIFNINEKYYKKYRGYKYYNEHLLNALKLHFNVYILCNFEDDCKFKGFKNDDNKYQYYLTKYYEENEIIKEVNIISKEGEIFPSSNKINGLIKVKFLKENNKIINFLKIYTKLEESQLNNIYFQKIYNGIKQSEKIFI